MVNFEYEVWVHYGQAPHGGVLASRDTALIATCCDLDEARLLKEGAELAEKQQAAHAEDEGRVRFAATFVIWRTTTTVVRELVKDSDRE